MNSNTRFSLTIPGNPIPKARPRVVDGRAFTPSRTKEYEALVREYARVAWGNREPWAGPVALTMLFFRATAHRADLDNLVKAVTDALQGVVYDNDAQVAILHAERYIDRDDPRVEILVERL
jgi:crossover junction endodeoxyribonuclease RusA